MSIHKLTAGTGYDYLIRQVAAHDATGKGGVGLATYYTESGETPGVWAGSGMAGVEGLAAGDVVTAAQMTSLFGAGYHPLADERVKELDLRVGRFGVPLASAADYRAAQRMGRPYRTYAGDVSGFAREVGTRLEAFNHAAGLPGDWPVPAADRSRIRTEVAVDFFTAEHGRAPTEARELAATIAKHSRPKTTAVAGYDLTFSPVKSFSVMWALTTPATAALLEQAHHQAVTDALSFIEEHGLFTREGADGVRQVTTGGLVATAFTHRDSRAGDPDLHTHAAVANKVQTRDGKWLAIDGQPLHKMVVAASEVYNTRLETHARALVGVQFAERPNPDPRKRPVREIVGIDPGLAQQFSKRRALVEQRRGVLAAEFQATHGRPPTPIETIQLAQQATLETREAKHEPRTVGEQRAAWMLEAVGYLGQDRKVATMLAAALQPPAGRGTHVDAQWFTATVASIVSTMEGTRAAWQNNHVTAEAWRRIRAADIPADHQATVSAMLVDEVLSGRCVCLEPAAETPGATGATVGDTVGKAVGDAITEPEVLRKTTGATAGQSVYTKTHTQLFTTEAVLAAEQRLVAAAGRTDGHAVAPMTVEQALVASAANGVRLNPGQATMVREMATSGARVQLAIAPAGSGKTTTMNVLARAWAAEGGTVIGLGPSATAAAELGTQLASAHQPLPAPGPRAGAGAGAGAAAGLRGESTGGTRTCPQASPPAPRHSPGHDSGNGLGHDSGWDSGRGAIADTLASLTYALDHELPLPAWANHIDEHTLVVIDEAGMADTLSLDTAVGFIVRRGGSVRLVGDDQQLAAIGAGGVLRDIRATHGALQLNELMRFTDPAEAAASLALREGQPEALGYYLDHQRVHVGDTATMTEHVLAAWQDDRARGLDSIMLSPTRDLVADLNARARGHRLTGLTPAEIGETVRLADGNQASVGDVIITRRNNRSLRMTSTDWVKNGDRWTILDVGRGGRLSVRHTKTGRTLGLPADYVSTHTDLGYACTVHTAQGVTADTMHGLADGRESRQQLYTMMTRGRLANHVYLAVVGDGDPHTVIRPELIHPDTPTDTLHQILARDLAPKSATTLRRDATDPAARLAHAAATYTDAVYFAAEQVLDPTLVAGLEGAVDQVVPDLTDSPAWPTLRAHLLLAAVAGHDPIARLTGAAEGRELTSADDPAAVLDWRLNPIGHHSDGDRDTAPRPLPWLPAIPTTLAQHPDWASYLTRRADLVTDLADQVRSRAEAATLTPAWAISGTRPPAGLAAQIEVWRAAVGVEPTDRRPTGPPQLHKAATLWQRRLGRQLDGNRAPALREWQPLLASLDPTILRDPFAPHLAGRLAAISRAGINAHHLATTAANTSPVPDDHAAAALWWRISAHISPAVAARLDEHDHLTPATWTRHLTDLIGHETTTKLQHSSWWPALVSVVDHGLQRGWTLPALLGLDPYQPAAGLPEGLDHCQVLIWRASIALDDQQPDQQPDRPPPPERHDDDLPPHDLHTLLDDLRPTDNTAGGGTDAYTTPDPDWTATDHTAPPDPHDQPPHDQPPEPQPAVDGDVLDADVERILVRGSYLRDLRVIDEEAFNTDSDIRRAFQRAEAWDHSPLTRARMLQLNQLTQDFYETHFTSNGAWGRDYLASRFGLDLAGHEHFRPGQAPAGWHTLVDHLRHHGVTDQDMVTTGVATIARNGNLIDRFRDRVMFPITATPPPAADDHAAGIGKAEIVGFIGRSHPDHTDDRIPKYLNTPTTPMFNKGAQLFGAVEPLLAAGGTPVIVEGPMDAIAVTLATIGTHVGLAPLGTSLTTEQVAQLARLHQRTGRDPIVATDGDLAGQVAAERDFWLLTGIGLDPLHIQLPEGRDPADLLTNHGPAALAAALAHPLPLGHTLLTERLDHLPEPAAHREAFQVLAAQPSHAWNPGIAHITSRLQISQTQARRDLAGAITTWDTDPQRAAQAALADITAVKTRLEHASHDPSQRWVALARATDPRLLQQHDWPVLAQILQDIADTGHDVATTVTRSLTDRPLRADHPARELRYRLANLAPPDPTPAAPTTPTDPARPLNGTTEHRRQPPTAGPSPATGPTR